MMIPKFRAWNQRDYEYINEINAVMSLDGSHIWWDINDSGDMKYEDDPENYKLEQYTGLKDANGKDIYEGDIVQFPILGKPHREIVAWSDMDSAFIVGMMYLSRFQPKMEVLGNVHTNPGLLEEDNV